MLTIKMRVTPDWNKNIIYITRFVAALGVAAGAAFANDYYVDAVSGSNANNGTSPAQAWKSVSYALAHVPVPTGHTIHLAPGTYGAVNGESFPWAILPNLKITGNGEPASVIVDGGNGAGQLIVANSLVNNPPLTSATQVSKLTLRRSATGISIFSNFAQVQTQFTDLILEDFSQRGVALSAGLVSPFSGGSFAPTFRNCIIRNSKVGIEATSPLPSSLTLIDCTMESNTDTGLKYSANAGGNSISLTRCRIHHNANAGIAFTAVAGSGVFTGQNIVNITESLFHHNLAGALITSNLAPFVNINISMSTLADNVQHGISITSAAANGVALALAGSILYHNSDDLQLTQIPIVGVTNCDIGDGDFAGSNGNITIDPLFVNSAQFDYRLAFGSPCIDLMPAAPGVKDLNGLERDLDGNLDTVAASDLGCHEFAELQYFGPVKIGSTFTLELFGSDGYISVLYASGQPLPPFPTITPYGLLELAPGFVLYDRIPTWTHGMQYSVTIPNDALLVGTWFSIQGAYNSAAAPRGFAYGNAISIPITQ